MSDGIVCEREAMTTQTLLDSAKALAVKGDAAQAVKLLSPVAIQLGLEGDRESLAEVHHIFGLAEAGRENWRFAIASFRRAAHMTPNPSKRLRYTRWLAYSHQMLDNLSGAMRYDRYNLLLARKIGDADAERRVLLSLAFDGLRKNNYWLAVKDFQNVLRLAAVAGDAEACFNAHANLAYAYNMLGFHRQAVAHCGEAQKYPVPSGERAYMLTEMVIALAETGDVGEATKKLQALKRLTPARQHGLYKAMLDKAEGILQKKRGHAEEAVELLLRSADAYRQNGYPERHDETLAQAVNLRGGIQK